MAELVNAKLRCLFVGSQLIQLRAPFIAGSIELSTEARRVAFRFRPGAFLLIIATSLVAWQVGRGCFVWGRKQ